MLGAGPGVKASAIPSEQVGPSGEAPGAPAPPASVGPFKGNLRRIADSPDLSGYLRDLCQTPGIAGTVDLRPIKGRSYESQRLG